jgi:hypothetical protein
LTLDFVPPRRRRRGPPYFAATSQNLRDVQPYAHQSSGPHRAVSHRDRDRICGHHGRWPSRSLARSQSALPRLVAARLLRGDRRRPEWRRVEFGSQPPGGSEARAQFDGPQRAVHVRVADHEATSISTLPTNMLLLPQNPDDLLFREPAPRHV